MKKQKMVDKPEAVKMAENILGELEESKVNMMLQDNKYEFPYDGETYRVRKATFAEQRDANKAKQKKYMELLRDDDYLFAKDLKEMYKKKGVDIDGMMAEMVQLENLINDYNIKLGKLLKSKAKKETTESDCKIIKDKISELQLQQADISYNKMQLMEYCIENQIEIYLYSYLTFLVAEKKVEDNWQKVWKTYDEYINADEKLLEAISTCTAILLTNAVSDAS